MPSKCTVYTVHCTMYILHYGNQKLVTNIFYIYIILGEDWGERKTICNKFIQESAVTAMVWPSDQPSFIIGLASGKIRICNVRSNKSQPLYGSESSVVALATQLVFN